MINLDHAVDFDGALFILDDESRISVSRKLVKNARQTFRDFSVSKGTLNMNTILRPVLELTVMIPVCSWLICRCRPI